jgi:hypothetical protein
LDLLAGIYILTIDLGELYDLWYKAGSHCKTSNNERDSGHSEVIYRVAIHGIAVVCRIYFLAIVGSHES